MVRLLRESKLKFFKYVALFGGAMLLAFVTAATAAQGDITLVAGTNAGNAGDGGLATAAQLNQPHGVAALASGGVLIADTNNNRVRKVAPDGTITAFAGTGSSGNTGDGGPATAAKLNAPEGVAIAADGTVLIADTGNHRIRAVATDGTISTVAGTSAGNSGDNGPATAAKLDTPGGVTPLPGGGFLIADTKNNLVRRVAPDGTITTVAGTGAAGNTGDGGPATAAKLSAPGDVSPTAAGGFLIADTANHKIRAVAADGTITTVAGTGAPGSAGDGGAATAAQLNQPGGVDALIDGSFRIADTKNNSIREVAVDGTITTVAGTGSSGNTGDGGPATAAKLNAPDALSTTADGGFVIADTGNHRIRVVEGAPAAPPSTTTTDTSTTTTTQTTTTDTSTTPTTTTPTTTTPTTTTPTTTTEAPVPDAPPVLAEQPPSNDPTETTATTAIETPPANTPLVHYVKLDPVRIPTTVTASPAGVVPLSLGCPADATARCVGTVDLYVPAPVRSKKASMARRGQPIKVGSGKFSVAAGKKTTVKVHMSRRGKQLLAQKGSLKVTAKISRRGGPNLAQEKQSAKLKIKAPKKGKRA